MWLTCEVQMQLGRQRVERRPGGLAKRLKRLVGTPLLQTKIRLVPIACEGRQVVLRHLCPTWLARSRTSKGFRRSSRNIES